MSGPTADASDAVRRSGPEPEVLIDLGEPATRTTTPPRRVPIAVAAGIAVAAVVAAAAGGFQYVGRNRSHVLLAPRPTATEKTEPAFPVKDIPPLVPQHAVFTDATHGYIVMARCPTQKFEECTSDLSVTVDGGRTWTRRALPGTATPFGTGELLVLDGGTLVVEQPAGDDMDPGTVLTVPPTLDPSGFPAHHPAKRWVSTDGGQSWREVTREPSGTIVQVPASGLLFFPAPDENMIGGLETGPPNVEVVLAQMARQAAVLLPDGSSARLRNGPTDKRFLGFGVQHASDGSIWVVGFAPEDLRAQHVTNGTPPPTKIRVSHDRGRSWQDVRVPDGGFTVGFGTVDGRSLYHLTSSNDAAATLTVSHDAGRTWTSRALGGAVGDPGSMAALPGGGALVFNGGKLWRLQAGSTDLVEVPAPRDIVAIIPAGRWVMAFAQELKTFYASPDGIDWIALDIA